MEQLFTKDGRLFLNREKEIDFINEKIKDLSSTVNHEVAGTPSVIYFYGVGGLGKTSLIDQIKRKAEKIDEASLPVALIDFGNNGKYQNKSGKENILKDIVNQLNVDIDVTGKDIDSEDIGESLKNKKRPFILLFDTLESANIENFKWLQEKIVAPLLSGNVLIAYAGRKKGQDSDLFFPWSIRRYLKYFPLQKFNEKQTRDHITRLLKGNSVKIPKDVMELTGGIPGLNEEIADLIVANPDYTSQDYLKHIVENEIFNIDEKWLSFKKDLEYVSILRQFDNRLLDKLIKELGWRKYGEDIRSEKFLIQKMLASTLLENYPDGYGYVFAINYRRMVDNYFRIFKKEEHFKVSKLCYDWYTQEIKDGDGVAIADQIYYLVTAWYDLSQDPDLDRNLPDEFLSIKLPKSENRQKELKKLLVSNLGKLKKSNQKRLFTIVNKIKRVLEGEEFSWFMTQLEIDELQSICDKFV